MDLMAIPPSLRAAFSDSVNHVEDLSPQLIEQQVVIAEMGAAHVSMKVLRLEIQSEHVAK